MLDLGDALVVDVRAALGDETTKIIPGHGPLSNKAELKAWHDMLVEIRTAVKKQADAGKSLADIQKQNLTAKWDERWGGKFIKAEQVVDFAFAAIKAAKPAKK